MKNIVARKNPDRTVDLYAKQGCTLRLDLIIQTKQEDGSYLPVDLTDYQAICQIRESAASEIVVAEFDCVIPAGTDGAVNCTMAMRVSSGIAQGKYLYDLKIFHTDPEDAFRPIEGHFIVDPEISREES